MGTDGERETERERKRAETNRKETDVERGREQ